MSYSLIRATNHHAVAAINAPDATAGAHIYVVDAFRAQTFGATDIVFEHRSTVNDDVTGFLTMYLARLHPLQ